MRTSEIVEINTSLCKLFEVDDYVSTDNQLVGKKVTYIIGDLHGNALKFIYFLFYSGIALAEKRVQSNIQKAYHTKNYALFKESLKKVMVHKLNIKNIKLILTGDTLCDRGNSDFMTLLVYKFIAEQNINFTVCLSNHDSAFIYQVKNFSDTKQWANRMPLQPTTSFDLNQISIDDQNLCLNIFYNIYLPQLKLITYNICNDKEIVCSHAPCNYDIIKFLHPVSKKLSLKELIQAINLDLQDAINNNDFDYSWIENRCHNFIWNREVDAAKPRGNIINIFGHIGEYDIKNLNQMNLDSNIGKSSTLNNGLLRIYKIISDDLVYKFRSNLVVNNKNDNTKYLDAKYLVKIIKKVKDSSSLWYSTLGSDRKGSAFTKMIDICNRMTKLNETQIVRVLKILTTVALIPRGETTNIKKVESKTNETIKKTKSGEALLLEISKTLQIQRILSKRGIILRNYSDLINFGGECIGALYLSKDILYGRVANLENEINLLED